MPANIIIRKQKFKIKTNSEIQAFEVRRVVNDLLQYKLSQVYESVLGGLGKKVYADRIVINLGKKTLPEISELLPEMIKEELMRQLRPGQQLYEKVHEEYDGKMNMQDQSDISGTEKKMQQKNSGSKDAIQTDDISGIIYFLEKGIYPWWQKEKNRKPADVLESFSAAEMERLLLKIISNIRSDSEEKNKIVKTRISQQLNEVVFKKIIEASIDLVGDSKARKNIDLLTLKESISEVSDYFSLSADKYRKILADYVLDVVSEKKEMSIKAFLILLKENAMRHVEKRGDVNKEQQIHFDGMPDDKLKTLKPELRTAIEKIFKIKKQPENRSGSLKKHESANFPERGLKNKEEPMSEERDNNISGSQLISKNLKQQEPSLIFAEEDGFYIDNGGVIILHPFLTVLFKELDLLDEKDQFNSVDCIHRAVVLIHFLQTGNEVFEEHLLAFNKILCGMKPEENLPTDIILTENEKSECEKLLDIVIGYWEALKGASRNALRETFLTRAAKLGFKDGNYLLQIERNATDILIDRLPWGFGIVKFPWLSHLIHVEW